jgi:hypothetical protein
MKIGPFVAGAAALALSACGADATPSHAEQAVATTAVKIPESLAPFGDGYPKPGDPCRTLGESDATSNYLDDSARLVGCPSEEAAEALGGQIVGNVEGIRLVSIATGNANAGLAAVGSATKAPGYSDGDAKVPGTDYDATTTIDCGVDGNKPTRRCEAGVKRNWGDDGTTIVEVTKPGGSKRAIFFRGAEPFGADGTQADGSAGWDFDYTRTGDEVTISFGPETYVIFDALVVGG